jgi:hypothetical protein
MASSRVTRRRCCVAPLARILIGNFWNSLAVRPIREPNVGALFSIVLVKFDDGSEITAKVPPESVGEKY